MSNVPLSCRTRITLDAKTIYSLSNDSRSYGVVELPGAAYYVFSPVSLMCSASLPGDPYCVLMTSDMIRFANAPEIMFIRTLQADGTLQISAIPIPSEKKNVR